MPQCRTTQHSPSHHLSSLQLNTSIEFLLAALISVTQWVPPVLRHLELNFIGPIWKFEAGGSKTEAIDVIQTLSAAYNNKLRTCGLTSISSKCNSIVFVSVSGDTWTWACSWVGWWVLCCDSFGYVWTIKITDNLSSNLQTAKHYERAAALLKLLRV